MGSGEPLCRPAVGLDTESALFFHEGVLLLDSVPRLLIRLGIPDGFGEVAEVGVGGHEFLVGGILPGEGFGEHDDVVASSERVGVEGDRLHNDLGVLSGGLVA